MSTYKKIVCKKLGTNFAECTEIVAETINDPEATQLRVKITAVGINASDINFTSGRYSAGKAKVPFDCGFEGIGTVSAVGSDLQSKFKVGEAVAVLKYGSFAEYVYATANQVFKIPSLDPAYMTLITSGLTASIALLEAGHIKKGKTVLVTAAAGGTGQFAVQLAKLAGCTVIGTCSSESKVQFLKSIGCDRAVNYKTEDLDKVLSQEFPKGVDIVYESVGGSTFETCVKHLAIKGVLIVIGAVSQYQDQSAWDVSKDTSGKSSKLPLASLLLTKSASVTGFFLIHYTSSMPGHIKKLFELYNSKQLLAGIDGASWTGLHQVPQAIQSMYEGKNIGKIIVNIPHSSASL